MLECAKDPWDWLEGMFAERGRKGAKRGMEDPAIKSVRLEQVGRVNVEEVSEDA